MNPYKRSHAIVLASAIFAILFATAEITFAQKAPCKIFCIKFKLKNFNGKNDID